MPVKYSYKYRPTYGFGELIIEFFVLEKEAVNFEDYRLGKKKGEDNGEEN